MSFLWVILWFLGHPKKQNCVVLSTIEAKYIVACLYCAQILWMKQNLVDFGLHFHNTRILCDNKSAINISKNLVLHSRTGILMLDIIF